MKRIEKNCNKLKDKLKWKRKTNDFFGLTILYFFGIIFFRFLRLKKLVMKGTFCIIVNNNVDFSFLRIIKNLGCLQIKITQTQLKTFKIFSQKN